MVQLAWRFLLFQKNSTLAQWYQASVAAGKGRKTMIVALARKLLVQEAMDFALIAQAATLEARVPC